MAWRRVKLRGRGTVKGYSGIVLEIKAAFNAHILSPVHCTVQIFFLTLWPHLLSLYCCLSSAAFLLAPLFFTLLSPAPPLLVLCSCPSLPLDKITPAEASPCISCVPFRSPEIRSPGIILRPWLLAQYWTQPHVLLFPVLSIFQQVSLLQIWLKWTLFLPTLL